MISEHYGSVVELRNSLDCLAHLSSWLGAEPTGNSTHLLYGGTGLILSSESQVGKGGGRSQQMYRSTYRFHPPL